ncbi:carbamoyltransferase C-terminal domain-containing protein [Plantactinospora sp. CA-290183]|uniref:carbamoyltransferase C-terminal domain-containing protein n=1 Tax=Plantactinospora sp. CA-290183 TaxID=3240006 RepID=UPI003D932701
MKVIVGYNLSHDSSICVLGNGRILAACALERSSRVKRGVVPVHAYPAAMTELTRDVLTGVGLSHGDVDYWIATSTEARGQNDEDRLTDTLGLLVPAGRRLSLPHPGHHLAHASAAFWTSGYDSAAALVVDAYGSLLDAGRERETGFSFQIGKAPETILRTVRHSERIAGRLRPDGNIGLPDHLSGIGEVYRAVTLALGFYERGGTYDDAGKTMGLAPYGHRLSERPLFIDVTAEGPSFGPAIDSLIELGLAARDATGVRLIPRPAGTPLQDLHRNVAAQIQSEFEQACLWLVRDLVQRTGQRSLVLGGGCFLNSVLNARLLHETPVERLSVFPAATDDGNAVGAALYAHHVLTDGTPPPPEERRLRHVYLGPPRLTGTDVPDLARQLGLRAIEHPSEPAATGSAAAAIAAGEIIGWFDNRGELGPRALGARSILCHPGIPGMRDTLNARVKFRESFRPFAAAVLAEQAGKWFDMADPDSPFMLMVWPVRTERRDQVNEIVHVDGTCRVQTVDELLPGNLRRLLEEFELRTDLPMVLNTSFNLRGMPIVERPREALDCLYGSRLDAVFLGPVEVRGPDHRTLRPVAAVKPARGGLPERLLAAADGDATIAELAADFGVDADDLVDVALDLRRTGELQWAGVPATPQTAWPLPQYEVGKLA